MPPPPRGAHGRPARTRGPPVKRVRRIFGAPVADHHQLRVQRRHRHRSPITGAVKVASVVSPWVGVLLSAPGGSIGRDVLAHLFGAMSYAGLAPLDERIRRRGGGNERQSSHYALGLVFDRFKAPLPQYPKGSEDRGRWQGAPRQA